MHTDFPTKESAGMTYSVPHQEKRPGNEIFDPAEYLCESKVIEAKIRIHRMSIPTDFSEGLKCRKGGL